MNCLYINCGTKLFLSILHLLREISSERKPSISNKVTNCFIMVLSIKLFHQYAFQRSESLFFIILEKLHCKISNILVNLSCKNFYLIRLHAVFFSFIMQSPPSLNYDLVLFLFIICYCHSMNLTVVCKTQLYLWKSL